MSIDQAYNFRSIDDAVSTSGPLRDAFHRIRFA